ncbi:hypothetical protein NLX71_26025 [Paenibacillus sp. MZ04-78.2]|uniref:hypothetical protein n=1 Tax=Paenibacillus sp. MZ04-78.2 TaxID=2962034 RepID=UPI0020B7B0ED|nr:hypothetical protein [Paenibacillus sp. MZ04-78.2]MCP3776701.1 hypothetical protein [Paenibacillus sp. MZ04-78.2]
MKINKLTVVMSGACLSLLLIGSAFASTASNASSVSTSKTGIISSSFDDLKAKLEQEKSNKNVASAAPLAQGEDFQISRLCFLQKQYRYD